MMTIFKNLETVKGLWKLKGKKQAKKLIGTSDMYTNQY